MPTKAPPQLPTVCWTIPTYDRTADVRFPLTPKHYRFCAERANTDEVETVLRAVGWNDRRPSGDTSGRWITTYQSRSAHHEQEMAVVRLRHLFEPHSLDEMNDGDLRRGLVSFCTRSFDYFEDENGNRVTMTQIIDEEESRRCGRPVRCLLPDQIDSVLRFDAPSPIRPEKWSASDARWFFQFFDVMRQIQDSAWFRSAAEVEAVGATVVRESLPSESACLGVALPFRQLYADTDRLFARCCRLHNRHAPREHPYGRWVRAHRNGFFELLSARPGFPPPECPVSGLRFLDAVGYGGRVFHAAPKSGGNAEKDWVLICKAEPAAIRVLKYHYLLRGLYSEAAFVLPVLQRSLVRWVEEFGFEVEPDLHVNRPFG